MLAVQVLAVIGLWSCCLMGLLDGAERKVAPSYCVGFKLNCNSEAKKRHVCCLYPLPDQQTEDPVTLPDDIADDSASASGKVKIRPIKLPIVEKSHSGSEDESTTANEPMKQSKLPKPPRNSNFTSSNAQVTQKSASSAKPAASAAQSKRPRICIRLVVNCNASPEHRCCEQPEASDTTAPMEDKDANGETQAVDQATEAQIGANINEPHHTFVDEEADHEEEFILKPEDSSPDDPQLG